MAAGVKRIAAVAGAAALLLVSLAARAAEREVAFTGAGGVKLSGTLTLPPRATPRAPVPAVVLVAGSGPTNRDGNQPPLLWTGLLKQTAEALAAGGIASLRYDKRGVGSSGRVPKDAAALAEFVAWDNFAGDVVAACAAVRGEPEVDAARVALLGHSEGGLLVMAAALQLQDARRGPAAVVLVSTPGRPLDLVLREQLEAMCRRLGVSAGGEDRLLRENDAVVAQVRESGTVPAGLSPDLAPLYPRYAGRFLQSMFGVDPAKAAARLAGPVLVVQGEKDLQVSAGRDAPALMAALENRPPPQTSKLLLVPGASHNLKRVGKEGGHAFFGPVVPEFTTGLVGWLADTLHAG